MGKKRQKAKIVTKFDKFEEAAYENIAEELFVKMSDESQVRILRTYAEKQNSSPYTLFVVAGWASVVLGWDDFLMEAKKNFDIVYLETREKKSSILSQDSNNNIERMALDIAETIQALNLDQSHLVLFSSSFGALLSAIVLSMKKIDPFLTILIGPIAKIEMPPMVRHLVRMLPIPVLRLYKPIGVWWVKKFKSESPEQAAKYIRVLNEADEKKWKIIGKKISLSRFWDIYSQIDNGSKVLVIDESKDKMHNTNVTKKIASLIKDSRYIDLELNYFVHSSKMANFLCTYLSSPENFQDSINVGN
ncbi:MAG: alpha/beta fold hydrolase [Candidatus Heimdallarchaeaceae archaeon]